MTMLEIGAYILGGLVAGVFFYNAVIWNNRCVLKKGLQGREMNPYGCVVMGLGYAILYELRACFTESRRVEFWEGAGVMLLITTGMAIGCSFARARRS